MFGEKNIIFDSLCLVILIFLVKYNVTQQYIKHASRSSLAKHAINQQIQNITIGVSKALTGVKTKVKKQIKKTTFDDQTDTLLQQLNSAQTKVTQADILTDKEKTSLALEIKTIRSHIEHIKKESGKEPQELGLLSGPALTTAREVHKRSLNKKLLTATNKTGNVLITLHNELLGKDQKINPATSVLQGLQRNQSLLV